MLSGKFGAVASGHQVTSNAAIQMLEAGGNAFDAVVAATFASCVAEPILASLGGGGFMTARTSAKEPMVYDFFVHTPMHPKPHAETDFYPIVADFGTVQQEFHIGAGSIATPGLVKGLFEIHKQHGSMPMREIVLPALQAAREGVRLNALHAYLYTIVSPILLASDASKRLFANAETGSTLGEGDYQRSEAMADMIETLAVEGSDLFYRGEVAAAMVQQCASGGHLTRQDIEQYQVLRREPHRIRYRDYEIVTNPPPSSGGILIGFALQLIDGLLSACDFASAQHLVRLVATMEQTNKARMDSELQASSLAAYLAGLNKDNLSAYRNQIIGRPEAMRGTTHISVADARGNQAALTLSNGEGCGDIVPGCGFMLNNMLGEEDLNPAGFGCWQANTRMTSMMSPGLMRDYKQQRDFVFGSGGSNRIRTAILQVLLNIMDFNMDVETAVTSPRLHYEGGKLNIEPGVENHVVAELENSWPNSEVWQEKNLFFGGVHTVMSKDGHFDGAGDLRRGGVYHVS